MSRSTGEEVKTHIATRFIGYNGKRGTFTESTTPGEAPKDSKLQYFILLDPNAFRVGGKVGVSKDAPSYRTAKDGHLKYSPIIEVSRTDRSDRVIGTWDDMKRMKSNASSPFYDFLTKARYEALLYVLILSEGEEPQIGRIKLHGRAYWAYLEFVKTLEGGVFKYLIKVDGHKEISSDDGQPSYVPVFKGTLAKEETIAKADAADVELQAFFRNMYGVAEPGDKPNQATTTENQNSASMTVEVASAEVPTAAVSEAQKSTANAPATAPATAPALNPTSTSEDDDGLPF